MILAVPLLLKAQTDPPPPLNLVVPNGYADIEANSDLLWPLVAPGPVRFQQWLSNAHFPQGVLTITAISFRPDTANGGSFETENSSFLMRLSTTAVAGTDLSNRFLDNLGTDLTTVKQGTVRLSSKSFDTPTPDGTPKAFDVRIPFDTPFVYDTTSGSHLLLDIYNEFGSTPVNTPPSCLLQVTATIGPSGCNFDAILFADATTATVRRLRTSAGDGSLSDDLVGTGGLDNKGYITRFEYTFAPSQTAMEKIRKAKKSVVSEP